MIIPIRCMNCGGILADKWRYYNKRLRELKGPENAAKPYFMDATSVPETPEKKVLDELGLTKICCRKHFLTQVDINTRLT